MSTTLHIKSNNSDNIQKEIERIKKKEKTFLSLCRLFSITNKTLMIINFSTILFTIFISESNISLILSIYTLSFSILCDSRIYIPTLEKLIIIYQDEIIPQCEKCLRDYDIESQDNDDIIDQIQQIEKKNLCQYLGICFVIPKRLRSIDWRKITLVSVIYILSFISIAIICFYKSKGLLTL